MAVTTGLLINWQGRLVCLGFEEQFLDNAQVTPPAKG